MVIAALVAFAILLVAWFLAPEGERRVTADAAQVHPEPSPMLEAA